MAVAAPPGVDYTLANKQRAVLNKIIANTSGSITDAFAGVIGDVMPHASAFRFAYSTELQRLQDAQASVTDEEEDVPPAKVSSLWLYQSGYLEQLVNAINDAIQKAADASQDAIDSADDQATNAGLATSAAMVAGAAGVPVGSLNPAADDTSDEGEDETIDLPSTTSQAAKAALIAGVAAGLGGQALMQGVQMAIQGALSEMLGLGRNAAVGAMRQSMLLTIQTNGTLVNGWIWTASGGACIACLEMDGSVHGWDEDMESHPACACQMVPYSGPPIDDLATGEDYFNALDDAQQEEILGPAKYMAWQQGDIQLMDLLSTEGGYVHERSLKSLGLDFRDYLQQLPRPSDLREIPEIGEIHGALPHLSEAEFRDLVAYAPEMPKIPELPELGKAEEEAATTALDLTTNPEVKFIAKEDVAEWTAGSAEGVPATGWHYGTEDHIDRLMQNGADVARNRIGVYGRGFYIWNGELPEAALEGDKGAEIALHMENPFRMQWNDYSLMEKIAEEHPDFAATPHWIKVGGMDVDERERLFAEELQRQGYDGVLVYRDGKVQEEVAIKAGTVRVVNDERAAAEAAAREAATTAAREVEESPAIQQLRADRAALQDQRDALQTKQDVLSARWAKLVRETDFSEEDDAAAAEKKLAAIEKQQAANITKMDALDAQMTRLDTKIDLAANAPKNLEELQATVQDLQQQRLAAIDERHVVEEGKWDLGGEQYRITQDELIPAQRQADSHLASARGHATADMYQHQLEEQAKTDPAVKQFLKDKAKYDALASPEAFAERNAANDEWLKLYRQARDLADQGLKKTQEYADVKAAEKDAYKVVGKLDDARARAYAKIAGSPYRDLRAVDISAEDIAAHPAVIAAQEKVAETLAPIQSRIADLQTRIDAADARIVALDQKVQDTSSNIRDIWASARGNISLYSPEDARVPFSDTLGIPEDQGKGLWYAAKEDEFKEATPTQKMLDQSNSLETAQQSKARIADDLAARLENNDAFVALAKANKMTTSEQTSDLVMEWGSKFKPGAPMPWAMQMAARDEFGLEVTIRGTAEQLRAAENLYTKDGEALRAFMRAQYDATQEFFASNGISEIELYRGFEWPLDTPANQLPKGVNWGRPGNYDPAAALKVQEAEGYLGKVGEVGTIAPEPGQGEFEFAANALSSYSADANISWAFTRDVWGDSQDHSYRLIVGAKVPVGRIMGTAQTGFGSKAEAEIVVLGANDDVVKYTAMIVNTDLAEVVSEAQVADDLFVYKLSDGTEISILTKPNGSFKITHPSLGASGSKTVKTEAGVNKVLTKLGIVNTYTAPATTTTEGIAEIDEIGAMGALVAPAEPEVAQAAEMAGSEGAAAKLTYTLPEIDQEAEAAIIQQAQDALSATDGVASHEDAIALGSSIKEYIDDRIGPLADYGKEAFALNVPNATFTPDQVAWYKGDLSNHGGLTIVEAQQQYAAAVRQETIRLLGDARDVGGVDLSVADGADETVLAALQEVQQILPTDWLEASNDQGVLHLVSKDTIAKGSYQPDWRTGDGTIALNTEGKNQQDLESTFIHEFGHRAEDSTDGVWLMERTYYNSRTTGEQLVDLSADLRVPGQTKIDKWAFEYLGKDPALTRRPVGLDVGGNKLRQVYNYELFSTGVGWLLGHDYTGMYYLAQDEEYHQFILGILFGAKDHTP